MRALAVILVLLAVSARAAPPPGADPNSPTARWYREQQIPGTEGDSCCGEADGAERRIRWVPAHAGDRGDVGHWQVEAPDGTWLDAPNDRVRYGGTPTGKPVAWIRHGMVVCLVIGGAV